MKKKYKSPLTKLVKYFETSRDKWKARSHSYKSRIRKLEVKLHDTQASREDWRARYKIIDKELELAKSQLEEVKKKNL